MNESLDRFLQEAMDKAHHEGMHRSLKTIAQRSARCFVIDGREMLNFCSNDYLGLADDPALRAAMCAAINTYGVGAGASRLVCGNFPEHMALEKDIALFKKTEAALIFGSGYQANTGLLSSLAGRDDMIFSDKLNHASITDGIVQSRAVWQRYPHRDMTVLTELLNKSGKARRKIIVTDTVFSMDGDEAPLEDLVMLAKKYDACLMVDEAHALGVLGATGSGLVEACGLEQQVPIQMGTLSKAVGVYGAYAAGSLALVDYLVNRARSFMYTTALPPSVAAAAREGLRIVRDEPQRRVRLLSSALRLRHGLQSLGWNVPSGRTPIIPVIIGASEKALKVSKALAEQGIFASAIRPPTVPRGTARIRVTVSSAHTDDDINRCLAAFRALREQGL